MLSDREVADNWAKYQKELSESKAKKDALLTPAAKQYKESLRQQLVVKSRLARARYQADSTRADKVYRESMAAAKLRSQASIDAARKEELEEWARWEQEANNE